MQLLRWIHLGGPIMWPILACGVAAIAVILERVIQLFWLTRTDPSFPQLLRKGLAEGKITDATHVCRFAGGLRPRTIHHFLDLEAAHPGKLELSTMQHQMHEMVQTEIVPRLWARLTVLSVIGRIAPLLGLLGTVQGMILMFLVAAQQGTGMSEEMAKGIGNALITTFAGLCIAIPVQLMEGLFEARIEAFLPKLRSDLTLVLSQIREQRFLQQVIRISKVELMR